MSARGRHLNTASSVRHFSSSDDKTADLSSKQIWDLLTHLLYLTMRPLSLQTTMSDDMTFMILAASIDQRRKVSAVDSSQCFDYCYRLLFHPPDSAMLGLLQGIGVERTIFSEKIREYLQGSYVPHHQPRHKDTPSYSPEQLTQHVADFFELYLEFRSAITNRFKNLAMSQAAKNKWTREQFGLPSDLSDNEQNYYLSIIRAVDKFYPNKGTLANYVMLWLQNAAGSTYALYTGEAFNLTRPVRKQIHDGTVVVNNKAYSLDKAGDIESSTARGLDKLESEEYLEIVSTLQQVPEITIVSAVSGFPSIPTKKLIEQLRRQVEGSFTLPVVLLGDLPAISVPSRATRRDSPDQQRRRESIKNRSNK